MSFEILNELPSPAEIKERYPLSKELQEIKRQRDKEIAVGVMGMGWIQQVFIRIR